MKLHVVKKRIKFKDMKYISIVLFYCVLCIACEEKNEEVKVTGIFEAREVLVSSEMSGRLLNLDVQEGEVLEPGAIVGLIDTMQLFWLKMQALKTIQAIRDKIPNTQKQLAVYKQQLAKGEMEKKRIERLFAGGAATQKQLDDVKNEVEIGHLQIKAEEDQLDAMIASARSEIDVYELKVRQIDDQIKRCVIKNPIKGTVLSKYSEENELTSPVKALYKIADLDDMFIRVYVNTKYLNNLHVGSFLKVCVENQGELIREYDGKITWIASEAEFVAKAVQTQEDRDNLVYAVKIHVKNDGFLRVGMYANVKLR